MRRRRRPVLREAGVAAFTARVVLPEKVPDVAEMSVEPAARAEASPREAAVLLIVETAVDEEFQVTDSVMSWLLLSEKMPVAENCFVVPGAMDGLIGSTLSESSDAALTVSAALPEKVPDVAEMSVEPAATAADRPRDPAVLLTVATVVDVELQVTDAVRSCVLLSEKMPVAVNCLVVPRAMRAAAGDTSSASSDAARTFSVVLPETVPEAAVIVVVPAASALARPWLPTVLLIVDTAVDDELQVTEAVRSKLVWSE